MEWEGGAQALVGFRAEHAKFPNYTDYHRIEVYNMILLTMICWCSIKDAFHPLLLMGAPMFWAGFDKKAISALADKEEYVKNMTKVI